jgi:thioredoxin reductase (NADPH)
MAECKIEILWNTIPLEIKADQEGVRAVQIQDIKTAEQRELPTEGVFVFVGFFPNNQLVPAGVRMNADGYVMTDEKCETGIRGLYVVGDLREKYARQIVMAAADGCTAALAAAHFVESKKAASLVCEVPPELFKNS